MSVPVLLKMHMEIPISQVEGERLSELKSICGRPLAEQTAELLNFCAQHKIEPVHLLETYLRYAELDRVLSTFKDTLISVIRETKDGKSVAAIFPQIEHNADKLQAIPKVDMLRLPEASNTLDVKSDKNLQTDLQTSAQTAEPSPHFLRSEDLRATDEASRGSSSPIEAISGQQNDETADVSLETKMPIPNSVDELSGTEQNVSTTEVGDSADHSQNTQPTASQSLDTNFNDFLSRTAFDKESKPKAPDADGAVATEKKSEKICATQDLSSTFDNLNSMAVEKNSAKENEADCDKDKRLTSEATIPLEQSQTKLLDPDSELGDEDMALLGLSEKKGFFSKFKFFKKSKKK